MSESTGCRPAAAGPAGRMRVFATAILLLFGGMAVACDRPAPDDGDAAVPPATTPAEEAETTDRARTGRPGQTNRDPGRNPTGDTARFDLSGMGYTVGAADAPIRVVEFSDFGCGYCRRFHLETYPTLHEEYVESGKVRWKYIPFVLGSFPNASEAAHAGECAIEQGGFPSLRRRLFEDQGEWRAANRPDEVFVRFARDEGLDADRFRTCLEEDRRADRVRQNVELGRRIGVRGTPTFIVQGYPLQGAQPVPVFRQIFEQLLAEEEG